MDSNDFLSFSGWPGPAPERGSNGVYSASVTLAHNTPGSYNFTVTATDAGFYAKDPYNASFSCTVNVIGSLDDPAISCEPMVYLCDPTNNPATYVFIPEATAQPPGTSVCLETYGTAASLDPLSGCGSPQVKVRATEPGCVNGQPSSASFRGVYSLNGVTCYSPWISVNVITPYSFTTEAGPIIVEQTPNRYIIHYNLRVQDQCGNLWPEDGCLSSLQVSETHIRCCTNNPQYSIYSGGGPTFVGGRWTDILSIWSENEPIPIDYFTQRIQQWAAEGCSLLPEYLCIRYYSNTATLTNGTCPGPCNAETEPCENP